MASNCLNCAVSFATEPEELEWISENDGDSPTLCPRCRAFKTGFEDESITCTVCNKVFIYPRELRLFSRLFGWPRPRRCLGGCRRPGPEMDEMEKKMAGFLKRLRAARMGRMGPTLVNRKARAGDTRSGSGPLSNSGPGDGGEGLGDSLAEALRQFQQKKRRRS
jgi:hypothetical protein